MKKRGIILIHLFFWFYLINQSLFPMYIGKLDEAYIINNRYLKDVFITIFLNIITFYSVYLTFPKIIRSGKWFMGAGLGVLLLIGLLAIRLPVGWLFWKYIGHLPEKELAFEWAWVWNELRLIVIVSIYAMLIRFMINSFESQKLKDELVNQRQAGELALLRSQINPHFLFNTLNNIYSLVYQKSDEAPPAIMKLSSIMRYMLYDANTERVMLEKEVEYMRSFIELQAMRLKQPDFVDYKIQGNLDGVDIAPMLLIPFVENAFKHGSKTHHPGIFILLEVNDNLVRFQVSNYLRSTAHTDNPPASGIGLANIKRRLELLYQGRYTLDISSDDQMFRINLEIRN